NTSNESRSSEATWPSRCPATTTPWPFGPISIVSLVKPLWLNETLRIAQPFGVFSVGGLSAGCGLGDGVGDGDSVGAGDGVLLDVSCMRVTVKPICCSSAGTP